MLELWFKNDGAANPAVLICREHDFEARNKFFPSDRAEAEVVYGGVYRGIEPALEAIIRTAMINHAQSITFGRDLNTSPGVPQIEHAPARHSSSLVRNIGKRCTRCIHRYSAPGSQRVFCLQSFNAGIADGLRKRNADGRHTRLIEALSRGCCTIT